MKSPGHNCLSDQRCFESSFSLFSSSLLTSIVFFSLLTTLYEVVKFTTFRASNSYKHFPFYFPGAFYIKKKEMQRETQNFESFGVIFRYAFFLNFLEMNKYYKYESFVCSIQCNYSWYCCSKTGKICNKFTAINKAIGIRLFQRFIIYRAKLSRNVLQLFTYINYKLIIRSTFVRARKR